MAALLFTPDAAQAAGDSQAPAARFTDWTLPASGPSMQVLLPPPPPPSPASTQTVAQLEQAEREDSGRGLQFAWLTPEAGFQWASLDLMHSADLLDERVASSALGPVFGAGAGVRLLYLTLGARFRYGLLSEFDLWSLGLEGALRVPFGRWEPYAFVGAGYARAGSFDDAPAAFALGTRSADLVLSGVNAQLGGGIDYFVTPVFSVGARLEAAALFLSRDPILQAGSDSVYSSDGFGIGLATSGLVVLGLHF